MTATRSPLDSFSTKKAAEVIKSGGLVVFPTDTVYGLGCDPRSAGALERLFRVKRREAKPIPLLCDSIETASKIVELSDAAARLGAAFWPGALTIVAPAKIELPFLVHQGSRLVGVRVPASGGCLSLIRQAGGFITGTSANLSGLPSCRSADEAFEQLGGEVDMVLDGGKLSGRESTVVRVVGEEIEVLRKGALDVLGSC